MPLQCGIFMCIGTGKNIYFRYKIGLKENIAGTFFIY